MRFLLEKRGKGYHGKSMSVNATTTSARPLSRWSAEQVRETIAEELGVEKEDITLLKPYKQYLKYDSWHHTSALYNKTDFYVVDFDMEDIKLSKKAKEQLEQDELYNNRNVDEKIREDVQYFEQRIRYLTRELQKVKSFGNDYEIVSDEYEWRLHKKVSLKFKDYSSEGVDSIITSIQFRDSESKEDVIKRIIEEHQIEIKLCVNKLESEIKDKQQHLEDLKALIR